MVKFAIGLPNLTSYDMIKSITLKCEELGYEGVFIGDHLRHSFESWTVLSALATETKNIKLGTLCTCVLYRYPVLLAKIIATVDVISKGRSRLGIGAGWIEHENRTFGLPFPKASIRIKKLRETVNILKELWTNKGVTLKGEYWNIENATCIPRPIQKPHPPIWICLYGRALLKLVAQKADGWNTGLCSLDEYRHKVETLKEYCFKIGRNPEEIENSFFTRIIIGENQSKLNGNLEQCKIKIINSKETHSRYHNGFKEMNMEEYMSLYTIGTPKEIAEKIKKYVDCGATHIMLYFQNENINESLEIFAEKVMPKFL